MVININGINNSVRGGMPSILIHLPPNNLRMGLLSLSAIRYMAGTIISVMKKAKVKPKIMVQLSGFQKLAFPPPKKIWGLI